MALSDADLIAASLAGGMIAASGRSHSAEEAVGVFREVRIDLQCQAQEGIPTSKPA